MQGRRAELSRAAEMTLKVTVGPPRLSISRGYAFLVTETDGQISWPSDKGLYLSDTRLISSWRVYANGQDWELLNSGAFVHYGCRIYLTNKALQTQAGPIEARKLMLVIGRTIDGGLHEDVELQNNSGHPVRFNLEIAIRSDFADLFEVKSGSLVRRGQITTDWSASSTTLLTRYDHKDFHRAVAARVRKADCSPTFANGRITFDVRMDAGGRWRTCLLYDLADGEGTHRAPRQCVDKALEPRLHRPLTEWLKSTLTLRCADAAFQRFYDQSIVDMAALRLPIGGTTHLQFVPAAGLPWFVALFGRDSLIASLQTTIIHSDFARGALDVLGRHQAKRRDDYRDAEPGKIMHELRRGELAHFGLIPQTPYYGTADATILYLIVLHEAWRCTGDDGLLDRHMATAEGCLEWIDRYGDRDGDGLQEYQTRSSAGYANQGWKDSGEALVYPDGSQVQGPKALCELQGYVYDAWLRMAEVFEARGDTGRAQALRDKAARLFDRFNAVFWDEASGFYAFALDGHKRPVLSVASNPGRCLWSGIVPRERAGKVVKRLLEPDMWSGWGVRTLSSENPAYDPNSYQLGSVWPHDNAVLALGFRKYGFDAEALQIAKAVTDAASYFFLHRMPELYSGQARGPTTFPVQYKGANTPQAWAAGSSFWLLQALIGFQPDAPRGELLLDPVLPDWMPELHLSGLRVGRARLDLSFRREQDKTVWKVTRGDASMVRASAYARGPAR